MRSIVESISIIRRDVIAVRLIIKPQIAVISNLERKDRPFIREGMEVYFGDILDGFSRAWDELEDHREIIESLSATSESITSYRINETIRALTVISVLLLPLAVIAGIYDMNVRLPFAAGGQSPYTLYGILAVMVAIVAGLLLLFPLEEVVLGPSPLAPPPAAGGAGASRSSKDTRHRLASCVFYLLTKEHAMTRL